jgi:FkbM family methyltransferase
MNRETIDKILLKTVRAYTYNTPIPRGKHRAYLLALKLCKSLPENILADTKDGRKFAVHLKTGMQTTVYFLGEYEKALTEIVKSLLREGDVCLDVGANFGWYSTLFHKYCGASGAVHAFEPMPPTFAELEQNYRLMGNPPNVFINNLGLGEKEDELTINLFEGLSTGHASMSSQGRDDAISFKCKVVTLDSYLEEKAVGDVNFIKVDIEGAEMMFLKGAEKLFKQKVPPVWLMEMAFQQTKNFGYLPNDLIEFMRGKAVYDFYKVDEINNKLIKIEGFEANDIGANVICFPRGFYEDRFASLKNYL